MNPENSQIERLDKIISLGQQIKKTRELLNQLIEEWNKTFPGFPISEGNEAVTTSAPALPPQVMVGSIDDRIVSYLDEHPDQQFNVNMLFEKLQVGPASLGTQLSKLYNAKKIARAGRGMYQSLKGKGATESGSLLQ